MRTFGRVTDPSNGARFWVQVDPDPNGFLDSIYLTALCQTLKLNYGESPFYGDWGLPAEPSVVTQVFPDYYVMLTQQRYAPYFMYLGIAKVPALNSSGAPTPVYNITVKFQYGAQDSITIIPQAQVDGFNDPITDGYGNPITVGTKSGRYVAQ
jgi:hypothetical protein